MNFLTKIRFVVVFSLLMLISATYAEAQSRTSTAVRPRIAQMRYDVMTLKMADPTLPRITFMAEAGKIFLILRYMDVITDQLNWVQDNECIRLDCNAIEIIIAETVGSDSIRFDILSANKHLPRTKRQKSRVAQIKITVPTQLTVPVEQKPVKLPPSRIIG